MKEIFDLPPNADLWSSKSASTTDTQTLFPFNEKYEMALEILTEFENLSIVDSSNLKTSSTQSYDGEILTQLTEILKTGNFHTEYQPILSLETGKIYAYEALARFRIKGENICPEFIFNELHQDPDLFFEFEKELKRFQIRNRPRDKHLFLNLDPHVCKNRSQAAEWRKLLSKKKDIVCEIIENTDSTLIENTRFCLDVLRRENVPIALDDVGGDQNLFCFNFLEYSKFIKFDKCWLRLFKTKPSYKNIAWGFLDFAKESNMLCILEGIETSEDFLMAAEMGFPLAQGYLFQSRNVLV
ncbi:cyclic diguanylate phosphodiesterase (EAL) domain protein [Leptospira kirschneri str. 200801925]|uniref:Cyclic diguanylate phosphodiesterase (EAL) domain protein n=1 Tax=Leptospira kirschneri str. 200802841 TaxID=1193047 RepID=A0A828Y1A4_9LEPT|nr:EAL domain-containing protein [Leptospira kirschneri]EKO53306.1 cyclic diguanylate phosphodiesterase (EAL) domain protein [Leptospira kirschneri str. 200802841]EMO74751.1 cyclic diguanylate phosphodiesterase (EAL) domain protein [Leptospira kirschneri str. 200801925]